MNRFITTCMPILLGFVLQMAPIHAQTVVLIDDPDFHADARAAIDSLYNRNEAGAEQVLTVWKEAHPDHPIWPLWNGIRIWWDVLEDLPDESLDEDLLTAMGQADRAAAELLRREPDHPDGLIIRAVANGYVARHHANRENWMTSMNVGRRAYQAYQRLLEVRPDMPDNDFAEGMKLYYAAFLPERYAVFRAASWFLPDGDKEEGLRILGIASEKGVFAQPEAMYFLGFILLNYENRYDEAQVYFERLASRYPDNSYYRRLYMRTLAEMRRYSRLMIVAEEALDHWQRNGLENATHLEEETFYWLGRAQYHSGLIEQSRQSFIRSVEVGEGLPNRRNRPFQTLSAYYAGQASERLNKREDAVKYYRLTLAQRVNSNVKNRAKERLDAL